MQPPKNVTRVEKNRKEIATASALLAETEKDIRESDNIPSLTPKAATEIGIRQI